MGRRCRGAGFGGDEDDADAVPVCAARFGNAIATAHRASAVSAAWIAHADLQVIWNPYAAVLYVPTLREDQDSGNHTLTILGRYGSQCSRGCS